MNAKVGAMALAVAMAAPGAAQGPGEAAHPVRLLSERVGDAVLLTVVGDSATPFAGDYALEVTGGADGRGNRSVQRGAVALQPHRRVVLVRLTLGDMAAKSWRATLRIRDAGGGAGYEETSGA